MNTVLENVNLNEMDLAELTALKKKVEAAIVTADARKRKEALAAAEKAASELGFSLKELTTQSGSTKEKRPPAEPKYSHPENPEVTWTGKGRRPQWFLDCMEKGMTLEDLAIKA